MWMKFWGWQGLKINQHLIDKNRQLFWLGRVQYSRRWWSVASDTPKKQCSKFYRLW